MITLVLDSNKEYMPYYALSTPDSRLIKDNDEVVGLIDYRVYDLYVEIMYITVRPSCRKKNYATKVINIIKNLYKDKEIRGCSLPGVAMKFWESLGAEFDNSNNNYLTPFCIKKDAITAS